MFYLRILHCTAIGTELVLSIIQIAAVRAFPFVDLVGLLAAKRPLTVTAKRAVRGVFRPTIGTILFVVFYRQFQSAVYAKVFVGGVQCATVGTNDVFAV